MNNLIQKLENKGESKDSSINGNLKLEELLNKNP